MNNAEVLIKFKGDSSSASQATKDVEKDLDNLAKQGTTAFMGLTAAADAFAVSILKGGVDYNAEIETYLVRLETLTGSAEEANAVLNQIKKDALKTPFDVASLTQAESLLLSTGLTADDARSDILALGDAIAASGGGNAELQRMAVNMQQIKNVGKASALDIKQFAYAGIDIYGLLADSMGITREEAAQLDVTYDMLSNALNLASSEGGKYYGAMEKQSKTYAGEMSNLKESIQVMKGELSKGLFNAIKKVMPYLEKFFNWVSKNQKVIKAIAVPLLTFTNVLTGILIAKKIATAVKALWLVMSANPIGVIVAAIAALVAGFIYLWNNCEEFRNFWIGLWEGIKKAVKPVIDAIVSMVKGLITAIKNAVDKIMGVVKPIIDFYIDVYTKIYEFLKAFIEKYIEIIKTVVTTISNVLKTIVDFVKKNVVEPVLNVFKTLWNTVVSLAQGAWNGITSIFSGFANFFKNIFTDAWNGILNLFKAGGNIFVTIKDGVLKGFKDIVNGLIDGINNVIAIPFNGINGVLKGIKNINILGHKPFKGLVHTIDIPEIPHLSVGTNYVPEDMMAMIHEGEAVVPKKFNPYANGLDMSTLGMMNRTQPVVIVNANFKQNSLGQTVRDIKTFSGGARNDFNYGVGV